MREDFAIFVLSHNSPDKCLTFETLKNSGYTGDVFLVVDKDDPQIDKYLLTDYNIIIFDKMCYVNKLDIGTSKSNIIMNSAVYARAAVEDCAKDLGLSYFIIMDDDIHGFRYRYAQSGSLLSKSVSNFDSLVLNYLEFMEDSHATCLSFANDGSFIGGIDSLSDMMNKRTCYTVFIRSANTKFDWSFTVNEDFISSVRMALVGKLLFTLPFVQRNISGMNDRTKNKGLQMMYETTTDFQRAFYATIVRPDACRPRLYKDAFVIQGIQHQLFPKIISSRYKKRG